jgi:transcription initiation factor TFIIB
MALRDIYEPTFDETVPTATQFGSTCPECGGTVHTNSIETTCEDCGLVLENHPINHGPEWTPYDEAERRRVGSPVTPMRHDWGVSAEIGLFRDGHGRELSAATRARLRRLRRWNR